MSSDMAQFIILFCLPLASLAFSPNPVSHPVLRGSVLPAISVHTSATPLFRRASPIFQQGPVQLAGGNGGDLGSGGAGGSSGGRGWFGRWGGGDGGGGHHRPVLGCLAAAAAGLALSGAQSTEAAEEAAGPVPASTAGSQTAPAPAPAQPRDVPIAASEEAKQAAPEEAARKAAPKATPKAAPKAAPKASSSGVRRVKAVVEAETGIRFPFAIKLEEDDKEAGMRLVGAGAVKSMRLKFWEGLFQSDYALGLYVDGAAARTALKPAAGKLDVVQASVLGDSTYAKTLRIVLAKETSTFALTARINDHIEADLARESFKDLGHLEIWRTWMVDQGGYKMKLPKNIELRITWRDREELTTEFRRRDKVVARKVIKSEPLAQAIFSAYLGAKPLSKELADGILPSLAKLQ